VCAASIIIVAITVFTIILFAFFTLSSSPFDVIKYHQARVKKNIATGPAKNNTNSSIVANKLAQSLTFQL
jgi:hypothetical protein